MEAGSPIISGTEALDAFVRAAAGALRAAAALLCDIDGTISPIAPTPARRTCRRRSASCSRRSSGGSGLVAFVTGRVARGRPPHDPARRRRLRRHARAGDDGRRRHASPSSRRPSATSPPSTTSPRRRRATWTARRSASCIEDKRTVLAVHYRLADGRRRDAARDPHAGDRAGAGARPGHRDRPLRLRGAPAAAVHQGDGRAPPARRPATTSRRWAAATTSPTSPCSRAIRDWGERDARRTALAVAAVTGETPRPVTDAADVLVRATPGVHEVLVALREAPSARPDEAGPRRAARPASRRGRRAAVAVSGRRTPAPASPGTQPCPRSGPRSRTRARTGRARCPGRSRCRCRRRR